MSFAKCFLIMIACVALAFVLDKYPEILNWIEAKVKVFFEARRRKTKTRKAIDACDKDATRIFLKIINAQTIGEAKQMKGQVREFKELYEGRVPVDVYNENVKHIEDMYTEMTSEVNTNHVLGF